MNGFVTSRVTAAAAAVVLGVFELSSARAADYSPPRAYSPPPEYAPPTESAPPQAYVVPPAYTAPRAYLAPALRSGTRRGCASVSADGLCGSATGISLRL